MSKSWGDRFWAFVVTYTYVSMGSQRAEKGMGGRAGIVGIKEEEKLRTQNAER
jgi:hypothetical protein